ncbi:putative glycolipid-binding domain-containing protein [Hamadaea sp. NPDC050747]|uniref:putative glycolipid-binding domain-containing protein n=1 Tax=Hamadaea sp. NPDC050747 TaxID=3155789 RepID=UPI0033CA85E9
MTLLPRALAWRRTDTTGGEYAGYDDREGLTAHGYAFTAAPVAYACRYELSADGRWASSRLDVTVEGPGFLRTLKMERAGGRWRITTSERGNLNAVLPTAPLAGTEEPERLTDALDVDLYASPLTNTLPIRRLNLLGKPAGTSTTIVAAWVLLPSLAVVPSEQTYTVLGDGLIRYASGTFTADLTVDEGGYVVTYPGLAER